MNTSKQSRGTKRKREGEKEEEDVSVKLRTKLHHEAKEVKKAGKKVKAFETQKLVKKLKDARKKDDSNSVKEIEEQLEYLKQLDHDRISILSLRNKLKKDKFLSRNPACEAAISSELQIPPLPDAEKSKAATIVESRFLSSKTLSKEIDRILQSFRTILGGGGRQNAEDAASPDNDDSEEWGGFGGSSESSKPTKKKGERIASTQLTKVEGSDGSDGGSEDDLQYSSNFEDEEGDAESWESGSIHGDDDEDNDSEEELIEEAGGSSSLADADDAPPKKTKKPTKQKSTAAESSNLASGSTFLPSLSVGFIPGNSDSEWSDGEADAGELPQRKNRRGQRARKAIWEKKYGRNANHIKKQQEQEMQDTLTKAYANAGRGRGRGRGGFQAQASRGGHEGAANGGFGRGRGGNQAGTPSQEPFSARSGEQHYREKKVDVSDKPIHPSWAAKMRLKEKQSAAIVPAQGKRITFS
ncbi:Bud-site selection protein [Schizopora paradoxa]|uniref:Bud-site selection protein n=1 Tax=Schizopora paradoxa TaxID=27342 RepID=A0A0H2RHS5_9AGAM|nr:Bud-site selection protein [Schizopora paradoxa]